MYMYNAFFLPHLNCCNIDEVALVILHLFWTRLICCSTELKKIIMGVKRRTNMQLVYQKKKRAKHLQSNKFMKRYSWFWCIGHIIIFSKMAYVVSSWNDRKLQTGMQQQNNSDNFCVYPPRLEITEKILSFLWTTSLVWVRYGTKRCRNLMCFQAATEV